MLEEPPMLRVRRSWPRPDAAITARFAGVPTGFLVDCMDGRGALDFQVKPVDPERAEFAGTALPCACGPGDNLAVLGALSVAEPGDVILASADAFTGLALIGDRVAGMARNRGAAALVTDGLVRDTPGIIPVGLPVFCRGVTPNSCAASGPGTVGYPIVIGGVAVAPGDIVVGDCDGVVVVPGALAEAVLARLDRVRVMEAEMDAKVAAGLGVPGRIAELAASGRIAYED
jgi:4-hydroxy-4-methyl-2-oxoglutarate aldolase